MQNIVPNNNYICIVQLQRYADKIPCNTYFLDNSGIKRNKTI